MGLFRATFKSDEDAGGGGANILTFENPVGDPVDFANTVAALIAGDLCSVTEIVEQDYTLPYPDGAEGWLRIVARAPSNPPSTQYLFDVVNGGAVEDFMSAFVDGATIGGVGVPAGSLRMPESLDAITSLTITAGKSTQYQP